MKKKDSTEEDFWDKLDVETRRAIEEGIEDGNQGRDCEAFEYLRATYGIRPSRNPRVKEILSIEPFVIKALWTDGTVRSVDFGSFLQEYAEKEGSIFKKILDRNTFKQAQTDGRTIYWDGLAEMVDYDGKIIPAPLDFCPDVLFQNSTPA